nr:beta-caryophyllene synthase-like [Tanacetum cinerariifolium]
MSVAFVSSGYSMLITTCLVGIGDVVTDESFKWALVKPPIVKASCAIDRIMDDITSHKEEQERKHVASSVDCYMKQYEVTEEYVHILFNKQIKDAWKDITRESLVCKDVLMPIIMRVINLTRVMDVLYKHKDRQSKHQSQHQQKKRTDRPPFKRDPEGSNFLLALKHGPKERGRPNKVAQVDPEILAAHNAWIKGSKEIVGLMLMNIELDIQRNLEPLYAHEMLRELKTLFAQQAEQELL